MESGMVTQSKKGTFGRAQKREKGQWLFLPPFSRSRLENGFIIVNDHLHRPVDVWHIHGRLQTVPFRPQQSGPEHNSQVVGCHFVFRTVLSNPMEERHEETKHLNSKWRCPMIQRLLNLLLALRVLGIAH